MSSCYKSLLCFFISLLIWKTTLFAQVREFRGAWIATVSNIDWPSKPNLTTEQQQQEFIDKLDFLRSIGCNAVIVQIRPAADAFYYSPTEPWSRFLTGKVGKAPDPYYDPLQFMIAEAHKRHMEFHAWFNPYRLLTDAAKNPNPLTHISHTQKDWKVVYGGKGYLNPGIPAVRAYVKKVVLDVVERYDIDAVHMDDYFYPYRIAGVEFGDHAAFLKYNPQQLAKDDWRRSNVDTLIRHLGEDIKRIKPYVKFGISPFGVWRNKSKDERGSPTRGGQTNYDDLYADVRMWMEKGWIDYLLPQLYWERGHKLVGFEVLLPWWNDNTFKRHTYYGLGVYRMVDAKPGSIWAGPNEIKSQIQMIRDLKTNTGFCFYSTISFYKIPPALSLSLQKETNRFIAIPPKMPWLKYNAVGDQPQIYSVLKSPQGAVIKWQHKAIDTANTRYLLFRFGAQDKIDLNDASKVISLQSELIYLDDESAKYPQAKYVVVALDRIWNQSIPSEPKGL